MHRGTSWFARTASAVVFVCLLALAAVPGGASAQGVGLVAVDYGEGGYEYLQVGYNEGAGFEQPGYDTSGWATGAAAFGSPGVGPCDQNYNSSIQTTWDVNTDLLVRKAVALPPGAKNVIITGTVDNDATVYFNGADLGTFFSGYCDQGAIYAVVPDNLLVADGNNLLAIRGHDYGEASYLNVQVTYDSPYAVCPLHDATKAHKAGSTVPLKLQPATASAPTCPTRPSSCTRPASTSQTPPPRPAPSRTRATPTRTRTSATTPTWAATSTTSRRPA